MSVSGRSEQRQPLLLPPKEGLGVWGEATNSLNVGHVGQICSAPASLEGAGQGNETESTERLRGVPLQLMSPSVLCLYSAQSAEGGIRSTKYGSTCSVLRTEYSKTQSKYGVIINYYAMFCNYSVRSTIRSN